MERQNLKHDSMPRSDWVSPKLTWVGDLKAIVREAGASLENVAKIVLYLEDFADLSAFDAVCKHYLPNTRPALSCVEIPRASPVPGTRMCVEAIAVVD